MSHKETTINAYAVNEAGKPFMPYSYTVGALSDNEVELEVLYCGICHSDVSMANNEWGMTEYPFVGGHEVIGRVVARGDLVEHVAVIGIGGLGHIALKLLSAWGCEVTAFISSDSKREAALAMGADKTLNSCDADAITAAAGSFDYIITTVNVSLDWNLYLNTLKPKGRLHFVGAVLEPLNIGAFGLIMGQRSISGSPVGAPNTIKEMFEFSKLHAIQPDLSP